MQLFQIFLTSYGILGLILSLVALLLFVVQVVIYVRLGMLVGYKNNRRKKVREDEPAVSIVVPMFSEDYGFVEERLPLMLKQEYREFEVVLVYVGQNSDFHEELVRLRQNYPHLTVTRIHLDPRRPISRKMALNIGIKAAHYECMLFSSTETMPRTSRWLSLMASGFARGQVVIGYAALEQTKGLQNALMRTDRMMQSAEWLSRAAKGKPYRGILHTFGFTKTLYFSKKVNGFNRLGMNIGEDDLFLQEVARPANTSIILSPKATVDQKAWGGLGWWMHEETYYGAAARFYPGGVRWIRSWEPCSRVLFFGGVLAMLLSLPLELQIAAAVVALLRYLVVLWEVRRIAQRLGEKRMLRLYALYDLFSPLWVLLRSLLMMRKDERVWR